METLMINNKEISLTRDINSIKLNEFKKYYSSVNDANLEVIDKQLIEMSILTGIEINDLEDLDLEDYKKLASKTYEVFNIELAVNTITTFKYGELDFGVHTKDNGEIKITLRDISLIKKLFTNDKGLDEEVLAINNLHILAGILFRPIIDGKIQDLLDEPSIESRASIFDNEMTLGIMYPYLKIIINKLK